MQVCNGLGVPKNGEDCIKLYKAAAEGGVTQAQVNLAARYLSGDGTPTNHTEAVRLARTAADKGDPTAQYLLGVCYETGAGVGQNGSEAVRLYRLSAAKGNAAAQKGLARLGEQPVAPAVPQAAAAAITTLTVSLRRQSGVLLVPAILNNSASANFVVDSGASDVVIPENVLQELRKAGKFSDADFTGTQMVKIADGSIVKARTFTLRSLSVSNRMLTNIHASVAPAKATPLLGQSFLQRFAPGRSTTSARCCCSRKRKRWRVRCHANIPFMPRVHGVAVSNPCLAVLAPPFSLPIYFVLFSPAKLTKPDLN